MPQGTLTLIWNTRNRFKTRLHAELEAKIDSYYGSDVPRQITYQWQDCFKKSDKLFEPLTKHELESVYVRPVQEYLDTIMSISVISARPESEQSEIRSELLSIIHQHCGCRVETVEMRYITEIFATKRVGIFFRQNE